MGEGDGEGGRRGCEGEADISSSPGTRWQSFAVDSLWLLRASATRPERLYHIVSVVIRVHRINWRSLLHSSDNGPHNSFFTYTIPSAIRYLKHRC